MISRDGVFTEVTGTDWNTPSNLPPILQWDKIRGARSHQRVVQSEPNTRTFDVGVSFL